MNTCFFLRPSLTSTMLLVGLGALAAGTKDNPCSYWTGVPTMGLAVAGLLSEVEMIERKAKATCILL